MEFQASDVFLESRRYKVFKLGALGLGYYPDEAAIWGKFHPSMGLSALRGLYSSYSGASDDLDVAYLLLRSFQPPLLYGIRDLLGIEVASMANGLRNEAPGVTSLQRFPRVWLYRLGCLHCPFWLGLGDIGKPWAGRITQSMQPSSA